MAISAKFEYACRAALELAMQYDRSCPVALREIAGRHDIPQPFLVQILQQLRTAGLVSSSRGRDGGYRLTTSPDAISLLMIADAVGVDCQPNASERNEDPVANELGAVFDRANGAYRKELQKHSLRQIAERVTADGAAMFYI